MSVSQSKGLPFTAFAMHSWEGEKFLSSPDFITTFGGVNYGKENYRLH